MKKLLSLFFFLSISLFFTFVAYAEPVLYFSDITSGPKSGLGDGLGQGAIVTIWGRDLGDSQGSSKVYFKDSSNVIHEAAHVYYWERADTAGSSGPADLWTYHKMHTIAFSIPSAAANGMGKIYVTVDGINSKMLDFTIRNGNIYYVKKTGNNSNNGSWSSPWATVSYDTGGAASKVSAGDIIYVCDGVQEISSTYGVVIRKAVQGTETHPISVIAYPGADYLIQGGDYAVLNWYFDGVGNGAEYWNFSKVRMKTDSTGYESCLNGRVVGCSFTDITCATGSGGAIVMARRHGGLKAFGNYIYNFGCPSTSYLHHTTYFTNRYSQGTSVPSPEVAWNYLQSNEAPYGIHFFDEGVCGNFTGVMKIHDNVVVDQKASCFTLATSGSTDPCFSMDVQFYNNLCVNTGINYDWAVSIYIAGSNNRCNVDLYNNTFYGYGDSDYSATGCLLVGTGGMGQFAGTWQWRNNIVVDTNNLPWLEDVYFKVNPTVSTNNLWYNGGDGNPANPPSWDTNPKTGDPLFVNPSLGDFRLKEGSPAIDAGFNATDVVKRDFIGVLRPQGDAFDIGAYELDKGNVADWLPPSKPTYFRFVSQ